MASGGDIGPLANIVGFKVRRLHNLLNQQWAQLAASLDVRETPVESGIVVLIGINPGITHGCLADLLGVEASTLSQAMAPLIRRGLVRHEPAPADRRARHFHLTETGMQAKERIDVLLERRRTGVPGNLDAEEIAMLHRLLDRMLARD